jgi:RNA polymerase sigma factor (TIGR02999 family)
LHVISNSADSSFVSNSHDLIALLASVQDGDANAGEQLFTRVYDELRLIARRQLRRSVPSETLGTTAVVNEAFLKLCSGHLVSVQDREHFFNVAARAMRQILVDHARRHLAQKRGGGARSFVLDDPGVSIESSATTLLQLDGALERLRALDERLAAVVDLRFYAGLSIEETAELLGVTDRTVKRDWRKARAFLYTEVYGKRAD